MSGLHLDGARLFLESAYAARPVKEYAALFDTVYISMYKYFNAASGALLAGPKTLLAGLYHTRRMFGGGLHEVWPFAAVALHYLDGFEARFRGCNGIERTRDRGVADGFELRRGTDCEWYEYFPAAGVRGECSCVSESICSARGSARVIRWATGSIFR